MSGTAPIPDIGAPVRLMPLSQWIGPEPWRVTLQHDRLQDIVIWITRGQGRVTVNAVRRGLGAHNALFLPAGTLFSLDLGAKSLAHVLVAEQGTGTTLPRAPAHLRIRDGAAQAELTAHMDAIQRELMHNRPKAANALTAYLDLVGVWLNRMAEEGHQDAPPATASHRLMTRFAQEISTHYATGRVMADYAHSLGVTPTHLTRVCRASCDLSAAQVLTQRKLFAARDMLCHAEPSIRKVSEALGFTSAAYFTRFMQQHTGLSPKKLREKARQTSRM